jgi:uncharacterized protein (DUF433 family)
MSLISTVGTSARAAYLGIKDAHIGQLSPRAEKIIIGASIVGVGIGGVIAYAVYEIIQLFLNEPQKREEQLEMGCHVATSLITPNEIGEPHITFEMRGEIVTYLQKADGVYVQHVQNSKKEGPIKEKPLKKTDGTRDGTQFKTLEEFQEFRRAEIRSEFHYYQQYLPDDLQPLLEHAAKISLSDSSPETLFSSPGIKHFYGFLTAEDINAVLTIYKDYRRNIENNTQGIHPASFCLELALLHNALSKIGTPDFDDSAYTTIVNSSIIQRTKDNELTVDEVRENYPPLEKSVISSFLLHYIQRLTPSS